MKPDDWDINQAENTKTYLITQMTMFKHKWLDKTNVERSKHKIHVKFLVIRFMHLADAFIQSDLQCIQVIHVLPVCYNLKA